MKLLFLLDTYRYGGGGYYSMLKFAEYLSKNNDVTVITNKNHFLYFYPNSTVKFVTRKEISLYFKGYGKINALIDYLHTNLIVRNLFKKEKFEFVIGYLTGSAIKAVKLGKRYKIPVANFHFETPNWLSEELGKEWQDQYLGKYKKLWEKTRLAYQQSDILLASSKLSKEKCEQWINKEVTDYIYPGVERTKKSQAIKEENQVIFIGRLIRSKNLDLLIRSLSKIENPPKLVIIGDGPEKYDLANLAKKLRVTIKFKNMVDDAEKYNEIIKSMFMVFPSSFEGFGMPPAEALACGKSCICSDIPIFKEVYKDKVEYFKNDDIYSLIKKIRLLIKNPKYRKKRGIEGQKYVLSKFNWQKSAGKIEKILIEYKNKHRPGD